MPVPALFSGLSNSYSTCHCRLEIDSLCVIDLKIRHEQDIQSQESMVVLSLVDKCCYDTLSREEGQSWREQEFLV